MPDCHGVLVKRGTGIKTWHKRQFILKGVNLSYFTTDGKEHKGDYVINSDTTVEDASLKRYCFCLIQHGRTMYMAAESIHEKDMWMQALHEAVEEARHLEVMKRASFKKREKSRDSMDFGDDVRYELDRISEITEDTSFMVQPTPVKSPREIKEVPKNQNPIFTSFESKLIHFHIMSARNLYSKGCSDTFARITVGNDTQETEVFKRDLNPSWNETFSFEWSYTLRYAKIEVWDVGGFAQGERFLGVVYVPIIPISSMTEVGKWYKLGKRSNKSHVSGEIYVDAYCDKCYDFYPLQILSTVQDMPDLRSHVANVSKVIPHKERNSDRDVREASKRISGRFMMQFPPLETEHLEDICLSVTMKPTIERGNSQRGTLFCDGILLLTNYRLIFVSNSRLMFNINDFFTLDTDLTTSIPLTTVVTCTGCSDTDPHDTNSRVFHNGITITTNDARVFTFLFFEDVERDDEGNIYTNRHATQEGFFTKNGLEKDAATFSNIGNDFRYLDAIDSVEGRPSKRFMFTMERKGFNRLCEMHAYMNAHHSIITSLQHNPSKAEEYDEPELNVPMLKWLRSLPNALRASYLNCFVEGWHVYDAESELKRMNIPDSYWRVTTANNTYELCDTYPAILAVPDAINDAKLGLAALFRSRGRIPVLSWRHPRNFCSITRSSQPLVGMQKRQCAEDEALLTAINQAARGSTENIESSELPRLNFKGSIASPFVIFDARPKLNATANQAAGKGYELSFAYKNCNVLFMNIDNIHVMRKSYDALEELCREPVSEDPKWFQQLEGSSWLVHVNRVLVAAVRLVHCVCKEQLSVLVHCSDGWDRTAQLTSLAMLMMDPFYRTYNGFQILIEKEWLSFGHKFGDRLGWTESGWSSQERSPVFMQFLDCVHQLLHQNPNIFEFNEDLLIFIMHHAQSAWFGNFMLNSEKDRNLLRLKERTVSIWTYVQLNFSEFGNANFRPGTSSVWVPVTSIRKTMLWSKWFLKWHDIVWKNEWNRKNEDFSEMDGADVPLDISASNTVDECYGCQRKFSMFVRRTHCFHCNNTFCGDCLVSKPDINRHVHVYCRHCFEAYEEQINNELKGISEFVLKSPGMTKRVLGSAANLSRSNRNISTSSPTIDMTDEMDDHEVAFDQELLDSALPPLSREEWNDLDHTERESYVEDEDTDQYIDVRLRSYFEKSPNKKSSVMNALSSKFNFKGSSKSKSSELMWTSGSQTAKKKESFKSPSKSSEPEAPKRFIPFSTGMMKTGSSAALEVDRESDPPPLAKKYTSHKNDTPTSRGKDNFGRALSVGHSEISDSQSRKAIKKQNTSVGERSTSKSPQRESDSDISPSHSPVRRQNSDGSDRASSRSPAKRDRSVVRSRSGSRSPMNRQASNGKSSRSPPSNRVSSSGRQTSRDSLLRDEPPPPSEQQISILPTESEDDRLRRKSSAGRFDVYKSNSVDLTSSAKAKRMNREESDVRKTTEEVSF